MDVSLLDLIELIRKDIGWLFALLVIFYEILWPYWTTQFQCKINDLLSPLREDINDTRDKVDEIDEKVTELDEKQLHQIQATRAFSRKIEGVDADAVDKYLTSNGVDIEDFLEEEDDEI